MQSDAKDNLGRRAGGVQRGLPVFPPETRLDMLFSYELFLPCTFIMQMDAYIAGTNTDGPSNGRVIMKSYTAQGITPRSKDLADYYFSWGLSADTDAPGRVDLMVEAAYRAFNEDKEMIEAQHRNLELDPNGRTMSIGHDAGPGQMRWILDRRLQSESAERAA